MVVIIPAAGCGSRLGELTDDRSKGLVIEEADRCSSICWRVRSTPGPTYWS
jgi:choline kinase